MTYEEIKNKLTKCEKSLQALKTGNLTQIRNIPVSNAISQLEVMKEALEKELVILEQEKTAFVNNRAIEYEDEEELTKLKNNSDVESIKTAKGKKIKELLDLNEELYEGINVSMEETKGVAKKAGKALVKALKDMGEDLTTIKAKKIFPGKFKIEVEFKNDKTTVYEFTIDDSDKLYLEDPDFRKFVGEVGVQPSGEVVLHVDVVAGNLTRAIKANLREAEGDDHHYIKVTKSDYKETMRILDSNIDPTYVKTDIVDDDGAGNVVIYFIFRHEYGFDDMYDDPEGKENPELYQEPDEDPSGFMYDVVMDLAARGVDVVDSSAELDEDYDPDQMQKDDEEDHGVAYDDDGRPLGETDEALDVNDPVLMRMRVAKKRNADLKKVDQMHARDRKDQRINGKKRLLIKQLKDKRAEIEREMENDPEIEPQGGPVADRYGDMLNKIDNAIEKAAGRIKPLDYDTAVGKVNEDEGHLVTFGYDLDRIEDVVKHLQSKYKEGQDFELHIGRGDDLPNAVTLKNPALEKDHDLNDMLNAAQSDQDRYDAYTDYDQRRREEDDYYEDPDYYKEGKKPGLWANIRAKRARGEKPAHKNSNAHKDAVKAGKKINKDESTLSERVGGLQEFIALIQDRAAENDTSEREEAEEVMYAIGDHYNIGVDIMQGPWDDGVDEKKAKLDEQSIAKIHKALDLIKHNIKKHLDMYKSGDDAQKKLCIAQLKALNVQKKQLEKMLDDKVAGTGRGQELDVNEYGGAVSRDLDEIFGALGYRQGFDEFIEDNPGCVEVIMEWISSISEFRSRLSQEYDKEELERLGFYDFDEDDFNEMIKESLNPEVSKKVAQFIKAMAKRYGYSEQDAVYAIMAALKQRKFDGVNEVDKKKTLKEFTDHRFKGSELIDNVSKRSPDMFNKQLFADLLPKGVASENDAVEALKAHDKSPIKHRMGQYAPMFVHVQYHDLEHEGEKYQMHQTQYYNSNFKDKDPSFNPGVSKITLLKDPEGEDIALGTILVKTDEYVQDLRNIPGLGKRVSEAGPGFKHDCAAKVIHKEHGAGTCIPEKHTLVKEGKKYVVTHYDVLFESGKTVKDIPVSELEIKTQNEHWHKGYKKKKK